MKVTERVVAVQLLWFAWRWKPRGARARPRRASHLALPAEHFVVAYDPPPAHHGSGVARGDGQRVGGRAACLGFGVLCAGTVVLSIWALVLRAAAPRGGLRRPRGGRVRVAMRGVRGDEHGALAVALHVHLAAQHRRRIEKC